MIMQSNVKEEPTAESPARLQQSVKSEQVIAQIETLTQNEPKCNTEEGSSRAERKYIDGRPVLQLNRVHLDEVAKDISYYFGLSKEYFFFGGQLVRVKITNDKFSSKNKPHVILERVSSEVLVTEVAKHFWVYKDKDDGQEKSNLSTGDGKVILHSDALRTYIPEILYFSSIRLLYEKGGKLNLTETGYNADLSVFVDYASPEIEDIPNDQAQALLRDMLKEFCFPDKDRELYLSRALAYYLTPSLKFFIRNGRTQATIADGNRPGVGKDLFLEVASFLYYGKAAYFNSSFSNNAETRKLLFSLIRVGQSLALFSNQKGVLDSESLEHFLTSSAISDRVLGSSVREEYENSLIFGISGNDAAFSPDMLRRILHIRLEHYGDRIEDRVFDRNLKEYVLENRTKLLSSFSSLIKNWHDQGAPLGKKIPSFEIWSAVVSGILVSNGFADPFDQATRPMKATILQDTPEDKNIKELIPIWWDRNRTLEVKAEDLRNIALQSGLFNWLDLNAEGGRSSFSKILASKEGIAFCGKKIRVKRKVKYTKFSLEEVIE